RGGNPMRQLAAAALHTGRERSQWGFQPAVRALCTFLPPARIHGQRRSHVMGVATRIILILALLVSIAGGLFAQETTTAASDTTATAATQTATPGETRSSHEIRSQFSSLLRERPPEVATILKLDPSLLSDESFLTKYPELGRFVAAHPEVRHNPRFYLEDFAGPSERRSLAGEVLESLTIFSVFILIAFALAWLVRTIIEQKRWNRLSRTQSEVHNKILDRFSTSAELLDYIRTPAGTKFLESAPIPLHAESAPQNAPLSRVLWSIQIGVVVAAASLGILLVSGRFDKESAQELFALGMIGLSIGVGFIASAAVSIFLSRRLGLWQGLPAERVDDRAS
ncbi:MAG: hypothetical protein ACXWN1_30660, partial [Thermoanaerobaculia bacterium]